MNKNIPIQVKAAFLIIVFSLNTMIGFACAIGIDMDFNTSHHKGAKAIKKGAKAIKVTVHVHADGKKHEHHNETGKHHDEEKNHKTNDSKDNCCHDKVIKITQIDKSIPQSLRALLNPVFFTAFISSFHNIDTLFTSQSVSIKYFVRSHHPPIPDIRIAIQSFQI